MHCYGGWQHSVGHQTRGDSTFSDSDSDSSTPYILIVTPELYKKL